MQSRCNGRARQTFIYHLRGEWGKKRKARARDNGCARPSQIKLFRSSGVSMKNLIPFFSEPKDTIFQFFRFPLQRFQCFIEISFFFSRSRCFLLQRDSRNICAEIIANGLYFYIVASVESESRLYLVTLLVKARFPSTNRNIRNKTSMDKLNNNLTAKRSSRISALAIFFPF